MKELRMPKGWVLVGTNALEFGNTETRAEKARRFHKMNVLIKNTPKMKLDELIEEGEKAAIIKSAKKASYDKAKKEGKLWTKAQKLASKEAKKEARKTTRLANKTVATA